MKTIYWNSKPGCFVNYNTGKVFESSICGVNTPKFEGSAREWYETLVEQILLAAQGMKDAKVYAGPDPLTMLQTSVLFRPALGEGSKIGTVCGMEVFVDDRLGSELRVVDGAKIVKISVNHG